MMLVDQEEEDLLVEEEGEGGEHPLQLQRGHVTSRLSESESHTELCLLPPLDHDAIEQCSQLSWMSQTVFKQLHGAGLGSVGLIGFCCTLPGSACMAAKLLDLLVLPMLFHTVHINFTSAYMVASMTVFLSSWAWPWSHINGLNSYRWLLFWLFCLYNKAGSWGHLPQDIHGVAKVETGNSSTTGRIVDNGYCSLPLLPAAWCCWVWDQQTWLGTCWRRTGPGTVSSSEKYFELSILQ